MRQETEKMCERSLSKAREGFKRHVDDVNNLRQREIHEARAKAAALAR